jgi:starvation-inducible DNA-binding protein
MAKLGSFSTRNDLAPVAREKAVALLNQQLADTSDLYSQIKQAHWNVKGMQFYPLHLLFDALAGSILEQVDTIAERATALGGIALGTVRMAGAASRLPEYPRDAAGSRQHVEALTERFAALAKTTRAAIGTADLIGDADTMDLFTQFSRELDKSLWMLESHLHE